MSENFKILITGITSIHGWPLYNYLRYLVPDEHIYALASPKAKISAVSNIQTECITNRHVLRRIAETFNPTHIVHCAGVCDLDLCEARPQWAHMLNVEGSRTVVELFGDTVHYLFISTDLVYSGSNCPDNGYTESHIPDPISVVGKTFIQAEKCFLSRKKHCILRLGLPLGDSIYKNKGAINWIESRFKKNKPVTLFYDELRSCIDVKTSSFIICTMLFEELTGLFHLGGNRSWSLYQIGEYVLEKGNYSPKLLNGIFRNQEKNGPPRVGNVSLNSHKLISTLQLQQEILHVSSL